MDNVNILLVKSLVWLLYSPSSSLSLLAFELDTETMKGENKFSRS